jgi:hypothetical protein
LSKRVFAISLLECAPRERRRKRIALITARSVARKIRALSAG